MNGLQGRLFLMLAEIGTVLKLQRDRILSVHATYAVLVLEEFLELSQVRIVMMGMVKLAYSL